MKMKKTKKWAVSLLIIGLMITSMLVMPAEEAEDNTSEKTCEKLEIKSIPTKFSLMPESLELSKITKAPYNPKGSINQLGIDIPVMQLDGIDVLNPSLATDGGAMILLAAVGYEDLFTADVYFRTSIDGGNTWLPEEGLINFDLPSLDMVPDKPVVDSSGDLGGIGSCLRIEAGLPQFNFPDIADPEAGEEWGLLTWNNDEICDSVDVAGWNSQFSPVPEFSNGIIVFTADDSTTTNVLHLLWQDSDGGGTHLWTGSDDADYEWENVKSDNDLVTGNHWEAFEIYNNSGESDGVEIDWIRLDGTNDWWTNNDWYNTEIEGARNPDIDAANGKSYCVFELNGGISCAFTNDDGENFETIEISSTGSNPHVAIAGDNIMVTYINNGNLISVISENSGSSWEEVTVNDESGTVADDTHSVAVAGSYIAWTHEGPDDTSIYFDIAGLDVPIIEIDSVSGGIGVNAVIKNTGTGDAIDIPYTISATGGILGKINENAEGEISISAGSSGTISLPMLIGLGAVTIEINVGTLIDTVQGTQLIVYTKI